MSRPVINLFEKNEFQNQKVRVYEALKIEPMTMLEVANYTNVRRANICWYIDEMKESGLVAMTGLRKCTISGYPYVGEYTSNPDLFPEDNQLKLFSE